MATIPNQAIPWDGTQGLVNAPQTFFSHLKKTHICWRLYMITIRFFLNPIDIHFFLGHIYIYIYPIDIHMMYFFWCENYRHPEVASSEDGAMNWIGMGCWRRKKKPGKAIEGFRRVSMGKYMGKSWNIQFLWEDI
jgi:hypothetical protein